MSGRLTATLDDRLRVAFDEVSERADRLGRVRDVGQCLVEVAAGRRIYVHVARGQVTANGETLHAGDALKLTHQTTLSLQQGAGSEVLVFDLPGGSH